MSVTLGTEEEALEFAARHGFTFPVTYDDRDWFDEGHSSKTWGFQMLPHTVLLDPEGRVAGTFTAAEIKAETPVVERVRALGKKFMENLPGDTMKKAGPKAGER